MELTPVQRLVTFVIVVLVLAGLCVYLFVPGSSTGAAAQGRPSQSPSGQPTSPAANRSSSPASTPTSSPPVGKTPDIYSWLPFTPSGLASAAQVTTRFAADYGTFTYRQDTSSYLAPMKPLMSSQLAELIGRAFAAPGVVAARTSGKQVSVGSAVITSLRAFGPTSLTFVVIVTERISGTKGAGQQNASYAITVTGSGSDWQVNNIELESAGNL